MKRRQILQLGGWLGGTVLLQSSGSIAALASARSGAVSPSTGRPLNVGIIGTGSRGQGLAGLMRSAPEFRIVACCDVLPFRLEGGLEEAGPAAKGYADYRRVLDNKNVDAVVIAVPFSGHANIALDALDAGKHVYCEKTMAKGIQSARSVVAKAESTHKIFQTGHQYHNSDLYQHVADMIKRGEVGKITAIDCQWNRNGDWRRPVPRAELERQINWRMYREFSGGLVAELCSHQMDFCNWVLDKPVNKIMGFGGIDYWKDGRETYDNVHVACEYEGGVKATFTSLTTNALGGYGIRILGDEGAIVMTERRAWFHPEGNKTERTMGTVDGVSGATLKGDKEAGYPISVEHKEPSLSALLDFAKSVSDGSRPLSDVKTGAKVSVMVQMAIDAMDNDRVEYWNDQYDFVV